jgi:adenylate cyclase
MKISLRFTFATVVTTLTLFTSLSVFIIYYIGSSRSLLLLTESLTNEVSKGIIEKTRLFFDSAEMANSQLEFLIHNGVLNLHDDQKLMDTAAEWISTNTGFTSVDIALPSGDKFKAERMPDNSISKRSYVRDENSVRMSWQHSNPAYNDDPKFQNTIKNLATGYDARTRPWWATAMKNGKTSWTDMYVSALRKQFVYSCVTPVYDSERKLLAISYIDMNVVTLSEFLATLNILQNGKAFILNEKGQVIAVPIKDDSDLNQLVRTNSVNKENPYDLYPLDQLPDINIRKSIEIYLINQAIGKGASFIEFTSSDSKQYVCRMTEFMNINHNKFTIGILIPKDDIMASINKIRRYIIAGIAFLTLVTLGIGFAISKAISRSLTALSVEVEKIGKLELGSDVIVNTRLFEVHRISEAVVNMRNGLRSFKKYVPADLVVYLNEQRKEAVLEGERQKLTIFFSDIADFTSISEKLSAERLVENLGIYFEGLSSVINDHKGTLDKYIGDCVMAFWGAPVPNDNHAIQACSTALACEAFLADLHNRWTVSGQPVFDTRIGLHTGEVIVGNIGSPDRMNYTVIGDNVNLASRLEGLNKYYGTHIILSESCLAQTCDQFAVRKLDVVAVKGKSTAILIYELLGPVGGVEQRLIDFAMRYELGLDLYLNRQWSDAAKVFMETHKLKNGRDASSTILLKRCEEYLAVPPGEDWNGVYTMRSK